MRRPFTPYFDEYPMSVVPTEIQDRVFRVIAETFPDGASGLSPRTMLQHDLGADSMQLIALMIALDAEFDVEFAVDEIPREDVSIAWVCDFVTATMSAAGQARP